MNGTVARAAEEAGGHGNARRGTSWVEIKLGVTPMINFGVGRHSSRGYAWAPQGSHDVERTVLIRRDGGEHSCRPPQPDCTGQIKLGSVGASMQNRSLVRRVQSYAPDFLSKASSFD